MDLEQRKKTLVWYIYGILQSDVSDSEKIKLINVEVQSIIEETLSRKRKEKSFNEKN